MAEFNRIEREKEKQADAERKRDCDDDVCVFYIFDVLLSANWAESRSPWVCWFVFEEGALNLRLLLDLQLHFLCTQSLTCRV